MTGKVTLSPLGAFRDAQRAPQKVGPPPGPVFYPAPQSGASTGPGLKSALPEAPKPLTSDRSGQR